MNINYVSYFKFSENDNACFYAKFLGNIKFRIKTNLRGYNKCLTAIFWGRGDSHDDYKQNITHGTIYFHLMYNIYNGRISPSLNPAKIFQSIFR